MRNNIKISFEKPIYAVDEKNGVVVCTLRYKTSAPSTIIFASRGTIHDNPWYTIQSVKAVAKVKDNDTFDVNIGKKVSLAKAENLAYSNVKNWMMLAHKEVVKTVRVMKDFKDKAEKVRAHNVEYIKKF